MTAAAPSLLHSLPLAIASLIKFHAENESGDALDSLRLADAALCRLKRDASAPPQVVIVGPTQTGKSTVVNLLLGRPAAIVSPLAGFTVHPQGFFAGTLAGDEPWTRELVPGFARVAPGALRRDTLNECSIQAVEVPPAASLLDAALPQCVVWDTPDFDSLAARSYSAGQLATTALADVLLLVLTKEKYADLAVWRWLALCAPLGRPLMICLNKSTPDSEPAVLASLRERLAERGREWGDVPVVTLPFDPQLAAGALGSNPESVGDLRRVLCNRLEDAAARPAAKGVARLIRAHWSTWTAPVDIERAARERWSQMIAGAMAAFVDAYRRDYLDHTERYDSFRRASLAMLELIELPGVGPLIGQARRIVTWPMRQLAAAVGRMLHKPSVGATPHSLGVEAGVLVEAWKTQLATLVRDATRLALADSLDARFWRALAGALDARAAALSAELEAAVAAHHARVSTEVATATRELHDAIQRDPRRLALLRTMRTGMDVSSILLAIKTGGLTLLDAVWAPAAFAAASLLLEGAANIDAQRVNADLKRRQLEAVRETLAPNALSAPLRRVADELSGPGLVGLGDEALALARRAIDALEAADG